MKFHCVLLVVALCSVSAACSLSQSPATPEGVRVALRAVLLPKFQRDIVTLGIVTDVRVEGRTATVALRPGSTDPEVLDGLRRGVTAAVRSLDGIDDVRIDIALKHDTLDRACSIPHLQKMELSARSLILQPALEHDIFPVKPRDILNVCPRFHQGRLHLEFNEVLLS